MNNSRRWSMVVLVAALGGLSATALASPVLPELPPEALDTNNAASLRLPRGVTMKDVARALGRRARLHESVRPLDRHRTVEASNYGGYFNVLEMTLDVDIEPDTGLMHEIATVRLRSNQDGLSKLPFGFPAFEVASVTDADLVPIPFEQTADQNLLVLLPEVALAKGDELTFVITADGAPDCTQGGLVRGCDFKKGLSYLTHALYYPRNSSVMLDDFHAELTVKVPAGTVVASTGRLVETTELPDEGKTAFHFTHDFETELVSFAMAEYSTLIDESGEYPITIYATAGHADNMETLVALAKDVLGFYAEIYAPFPFFNMDIVEIGNSFGGGYGPQATIMMLSDMFSITPEMYWYDSLVQLTSHELAHQYFGNFVNILSSDSVSMSEGLAEFSSAYHFEKKFESRSNFPVLSDAPIGSSSVYYAPGYQAIVYDKASVVFDMLRYELGEETFLAGMQLYVEQYGYAAADIFDFFKAHETISGTDLSWFFNQWIMRMGHAELTVGARVEEKSQADGGGWDITIQVDQEEPAYLMHLPLRVRVANTGEKLDLEPLWVDGTSATATYHVDQPPARIVPDPDRAYLQQTRSAVSGDVNLTGLVDGTDLIDLAIMFHRDIVMEYHGQQYFWPNLSYLPRFDLNEDGMIDESDLEMLIQGLGQQSALTQATE